MHDNGITKKLLRQPSLIGYLQDILHLSIASGHNNPGVDHTANLSIHCLYHHHCRHDTLHCVLFETMSLTHYITMPQPAWGHTRPELILSLNLLRQNPHLCFTYIAPIIVEPKVQEQIELYNLTDEESSRFRLVIYEFTSPMPCDPNGGTSDDDSLGIVFRWLGEQALPKLKKVLTVSEDTID